MFYSHIMKRVCINTQDSIHRQAAFQLTVTVFTLCCHQQTVDDGNTDNVQLI